MKSGYLWHGFILSRDFINNKKVHRLFLEVSKSQNYSTSELENLQNEKLKKIIHHAYKTVPYYRKTLDKLKLSPDDFKSKNDLVKLPVLKKETIKQKGIDHFISNIYSKDKLKFGRTGGSTGEPFLFCKNNNYSSITEAYLLRHFSWCGWKPGETIVRLWGKSIINGRLYNWRDSLRQAFFNDYRFDSFKMSLDRMAYYAERINELSPKILRGYANSLYLFAKYINKSNYSLNIPACSSTAEMLFPYYRKEIKNSLYSDSFDQYACGEIHNIAVECEAHSGLHTNDEHVIIELSQQNHTDRNSGELIVTDLDNYGMPFIRYETGDIAKIIEGKCSCGRDLSRIGNIVGRVSSSFITKTGTIVHGEFITHVLNEIGLSNKVDINEFQMIQHDFEDFDLNIVSKRKLNYTEVHKLRTILENYLGKIKLNINYLENVPVTKVGKKQFTISKVNEK